jgi:ABC-type multidrug transport system fused ATPase/permease subunit
VGKSGSSKTPLTYLLGRLIEPISCEILVNGRPIEEYTLESVRAKFGFCLQETGMLNRMIAENLKIGAPEATDEQLHEALFCAGLDGMKEDYLDQTSPGSGGQKQRLA